MSTFLELCRDVERDSGTVAQGSRIVSVGTAVHRQAKVVGWVRDAWAAIQRARNDWLFMRGEFEAVLTPGKDRYTAVDLAIPRFGRWASETERYEPYTLYDPTLGRGDESPIGEISFADWRSRYGRAVSQVQRPHEYAIAPTQELCVGAVPDKAYRLRGEYRYAIQFLTADDEQPLLPADHHDLIRHRALMFLAAHDEATVTLATASTEFRTAFNHLVHDPAAVPDVALCGAIG